MNIIFFKNFLFKVFLLICLLFFFVLFNNISVQAQIPMLRATNIYNEQQIVYNKDSVLHTVWKPVIYAEAVSARGTGSWFQRKFFQEHLLEVKQPNFNLNADIIFDEYIGYSKRPIPTITPTITPKETTKTPMMNTRGYEIFGNVSDKFYFETAFYENQGRFGGYVDSFIRKSHVVPGQGGFKNVGDGKGFDFSSSSTRLVYTPNKHWAFDLGYGKNFIGDGYRSLLLSDWSHNYPYFKTTLTLGKFQYNVMWSQYVSDRNRFYNDRQGYFRKWAQTFLIDWKATNRLSVSVFESVIWPDQDSARNKDMSASIASPVIFIHGSESPSGVKNNVMGGINLKYRLFDHAHLYGQFALDNTGKSGAEWRNRYGAQLGIRCGNTFGVTNLNIILEGNLARPYTYTSQIKKFEFKRNTPSDTTWHTDSMSLNTNYIHNNQPLAHPLGANFREGLLLAEYTFKSWRFRFESFFAKYGADSSATLNYGHDIFKSTTTHSVTDNVTIGQGLSTNIFYADFKIAYVINPVTNMRIETGFTFRNEKNSIVSFKDRIVYIGIRMSFRRIGYDF
ncbi:MAG TPA: hypothetical protein VN958_11230 [Chitinophagaceae bacterium]|nr:hypothetical protein [Chitinophagaceae bacterium]